MLVIVRQAIQEAITRKQEQIVILSREISDLRAELGESNGQAPIDLLPTLRTKPDRRKYTPTPEHLAAMAKGRRKARRKAR